MISPETVVKVCSHIPLSPEHQMTFPNKEDQEDYFNSKVFRSYTDFTYQREEVAIKVPTNKDDLYNCNYLMYQNVNYSTKWFYAYITKKEYVNPNVTRLYFELDVFQTWQFDLTYRDSFIAREHTTRWNADGSPVVNTVDEGLDYGSEYQTVNVQQVVPYDDIFFLVIVAKNKMDVNGSDITPVLNGSPQPLSYYIHPFKMDGTIPTVTISGLDINLSPIADVLKSLYTQDQAVNNIVSMFVTEYIGYNIPKSGDTLTLADMSVLEHVTIQDDSDPDNPLTFNTLYLAGLEDYETKSVSLGGKYDGFSNVGDESKLMMYPYQVTILTDMKGNQQTIKNEYIPSQDLTIQIKGSMGTSNKVAYYIQDYLMSGNVDESGEIALRHAIINNNPNDVPIITDLLSAFLQGNRNSIENQRNSLLFNGQMDQIQAVGSGISALRHLDVGGAMNAGASSMRSYGNMNLSLQGIMAKQKDISNVPPQISKMGGNTAFDYGNDLNGLYVIKKEITPEYRNRLSDYFHMFGYKVNLVKKPNLNTRQHFNYIQTVGANITGNVPHEDLSEIKQMFDRGVTLWHGDFIGDYSKSNQEV